MSQLVVCRRRDPAVGCGNLYFGVVVVAPAGRNVTVDKSCKLTPLENVTVDKSSKPAPFRNVPVDTSSKPASLENVTVDKSNKPAPF